MAKILSIIAPEGYQDQEYGDSKAALEEKGHTVITACSQKHATGKFGSTTEADLLLEEIKPEDYDAILFVGGPGVYQYFDNIHLQEIAKTFYQSGKPTTAICAAPGVLANAGLLNGKTVTCFEGESGNLIAKGANYTGKPTEQDGLIITGNGPSAARDFGLLIAKSL